MLAGLDDYVLDVPGAAHLMTLFLARAIVDELVPPAFLARVLDTLNADSLAIVVVRNTGRLLASPHAAELALKVPPPPPLSLTCPSHFSYTGRQTFQISRAVSVQSLTGCVACDRCRPAPLLLCELRP